MASHKNAHKAHIRAPTYTSHRQLHLYISILGGHMWLAPTVHPCIRPHCCHCYMEGVGEVKANDGTTVVATSSRVGWSPGKTLANT